MVAIILDQDGSKNGNKSKPKTSTEEFISSKETFVQEERDLLASEMDVKQLPHRFYILLEQRKV